MGKKRKNPSLCSPKTRTSVLHEHVFVPSGAVKRYGCFQSGLCQADGEHEPCAVCGWPADEHPQEISQ